MAHAERQRGGGAISGELIAPTLSLCRHIASCAFPSDEPIIAHDHVEKSISRDRTFGEDTDDAGRIRATLYYLTERCCKTLRQDELMASTVTVRVRFTDFTTVQKQATLAAPSSNEEDLFAAARRLLALLLPPGEFDPPGRREGLGALAGTCGRTTEPSIAPRKNSTRSTGGSMRCRSRYGYTSIRWGITCGVAERREERG